MKRDMDLAREILRRIEADDQADGNGSCVIEVDGESSRVISYHVKLLHQAGLIEASDLCDPENLSWAATALTNEGHDFLDAARDEGRWAKAKKLISDRASSLTLDTLKAVLAQLAIDAATGGVFLTAKIRR